MITVECPMAMKYNAELLLLPLVKELTLAYSDISANLFGQNIIYIFSFLFCSF